MTLSDKKVYKARVLGLDPRRPGVDQDRRSPQTAHHAGLGDNDYLVVGQRVLAIGNPFQFEGTLTTGIVSSLDRTIDTEERKLEAMFQTDAAINPGYSGGPLLDSHGNGDWHQHGDLRGAGQYRDWLRRLAISRAKAMLEEYQTR